MSAEGKKTKLHLKLLDHFELFDLKHQRIRLNNSKAAAMLAYLALSGDGRETRKNLAKLLWSRHASEQARASLRQCLAHLKCKLSAVDANLIHSDRQTIGLNQALISSELSLMDSSARSDQQELLQKFNQWDGRLLSGLAGIDANFDEWLDNESHRLLSRLQQNFEQKLAYFKGRNDLSQVMEFAGFIFKINPTSELAHRALMELYLNNGRVDEAVLQYECLVTLLSKQTGTRPSSRTNELYSRVLHSVSAQTSHVPKVPVEEAGDDSTRKPVISIQPMDYIVAGDTITRAAAQFPPILVDELVTNLTRFREFTVKEGQAVGADENKPPIYNGVDYVLKGQLFDAGKKARLNIRISKPATGTQLWANVYEFDTAKFFEHLGSTVNEIIDVVKFSLTTDRFGHSTEKLSAYDYWLKASVMNYNWTRENEEKSITFYRKAIALDSDFARAYSSLASVLNLRNNFTPGYRHDARDREEAKYLIKRALDLDPMDARNHINAAWGNILAREFDEAEHHLSAAYKLNPRSANIIAGYSMGMGYLGKADEVITNFRQSVENHASAPLYHHAYLGILYFLVEDYVKSCSAFQQSGELMPTFMAWYAAALYHNGMNKLARAAAIQFKREVNETWDGLETPGRVDIINWLTQVETLKNEAHQQNLITPLKLYL